MKAISDITQTIRGLPYLISLFDSVKPDLKRQILPIKTLFLIWVSITRIPPSTNIATAWNIVNVANIGDTARTVKVCHIIDFLSVTSTWTSWGWPPGRGRAYHCRAWPVVIVVVAVVVMLVEHPAGRGPGGPDIGSSCTKWSHWALPENGEKSLWKSYR